ncbi:MAG: flagellar hook-associated protein FlgL [Pseudomonadota bacterium]
MRVTTGMIFDSGLMSIQRQTSSLLHTQQQVASGRRILKPSDDPVAAARALEVTQSQEINAQYGENQGAARDALALAENKLTGAGDLLQRVRQLAVQAGNAALTDKDRRSIGAELRQLYEGLLGIANSTDGNGQYLFSGYQGDVKPFSGAVDTVAAGEITYDGDDGRRLLQVSASRQLAVSDSGNDVFRRIRNGNGYFVTGANGANAGTGVIDQGTVLNPSSVFPDDYTITFTVTGSTITYDVTDSSSASVASGTYVSGDRITIPGIAGVVITGTPANGDTFTLTRSSAQSVFKTVADLIDAVEQPVSATSGNTALTNRLGTALANLDRAQDNFLRVRSDIGARLNELDQLGNAGEDLNLQYQTTLSRLQDVDYAAAITRLTREQTYLEAAQKSFVKVSGLSLFDFV